MYAVKMRESGVQLNVLLLLAGPDDEDANRPQQRAGQRGQVRRLPVTGVRPQLPPDQRRGTQASKWLPDACSTEIWYKSVV